MSHVKQVYNLLTEGTNKVSVQPKEFLNDILATAINDKDRINEQKALLIFYILIFVAITTFGLSLVIVKSIDLFNTQRIRTNRRANPNLIPLRSI